MLNSSSGLAYPAHPPGQELRGPPASPSRLLVSQLFLFGEQCVSCLEGRRKRTKPFSLPMASRAFAYPSLSMPPCLGEAGVMRSNCAPCCTHMQHIKAASCSRVNIKAYFVSALTPFLPHRSAPSFPSSASRETDITTLLLPVCQVSPTANPTYPSHGSGIRLVIPVSFLLSLSAVGRLA